MVGQVDQPFGKLFGVAGTPEYENEYARRLMNFIGENVQKGTKWLAEKTGLPQSDIDSLVATASLAAPQIGKATAKAAAPVLRQVQTGAELALDPLLQPRRERLSAEAYARGPQIDAAKAAQRLGFALNPVDIQPSIGPRFTSAIAGEKGVVELQNANRNQVRLVALRELGLPETTQLNGPAAFNEARARVAQPYNEVKKLPTMTADAALTERLNSLRADPNVIGAKEYAPAIDRIIDQAISQTQAGLTGEQLLKNVRVLRERARKTYNNKSATIEALDIADTNLAVANSLESMIESNIFNPRLLADFRAARQQMARSYAYEAATDLNTGVVDAGKIARVTAKDNALTGDIATIGSVAGNFPEVFSSSVAAPKNTARIARTGIAGSLGGTTGYLLGGDYTSAALGAIAGSTAGEVGSNFFARRMASPEYQAALRVQDNRLPVNQLAPPPAAAPANALTPYVAPQSVLIPGEGAFVTGQPAPSLRRTQEGVFVAPAAAPGPQRAPRATFVGPQAGPPQLPAPSAESTMAALRAEDARRAGVSRAVGQEAEARQAAAEAAARRPAGGEVMLELDPVTGRLRPAAPTGQELPKPTALETAVDKLSGQMVSETATTFKRVSTGKPTKTGEQRFYVRSSTTELPAERQPQAFALSAEERIAWNKARADLAEVVPGMKALSDKAVAEKMMDRAWVDDAVKKARDKAEAFAQIEAKAKDAASKRKAAADRERMTDLLESLEERFRAPRPEQGTGQGPKTRAAQRNQLRTAEPTNKLILPD